MLQADGAERERTERERRQKLKQKARDRERTAKERAAAEREASEREARSRQEAEAKRQKKEAALDRWGCLSGVLACLCMVQCFDPAVNFKSSSEQSRQLLRCGTAIGHYRAVM